METAHEANRELARALERVGELLQQQRANPFRVRAYHAAAATLRELEEPVAELLEREGEPGLRALPHVGAGLASSIAEYVRSGRLRVLDRLEGEVCPEHLLTTVPGIGPTLAHRIHEQLGVESLEDLEVAAHDGRLAAMPGMGKRRVAGIVGVLGSMLRGRPLEPDDARAPHPPVSTLLELDARYRQLAARDALPRIAPRRFNPRREAWLPVLHEHIDDVHYTLLFSNTARAHRLGHTHDWVVIFYEHERHDGREGPRGQCTVVDEHAGTLKGFRVVRGREAECADYYEGLARRAPGIITAVPGKIAGRD